MLNQPINCYHVHLVDDDGNRLITGMLDDVHGQVSTPPGRDELSCKAFTAADMPPEVFVRTSIAPNGGLASKRIRDAAAAIAERFGYRVERYAD